MITNMIILQTSISFDEFIMDNVYEHRNLSARHNILNIIVLHTYNHSMTVHVSVESNEQSRTFISLNF